MKIFRSLSNAVTYFILCFICTIPFILLIAIFYPDAFDGKRSSYEKHLNESLTFVASNQTASMLGVFLATYILLKIEKRSITDIKLKIDLKSITKGFVFGIIFFGVIILVMQVTGVVYFTYSTIPSKLIFSFFLYLIVAISEEIMIRGYILNCFQNNMNNFLAVLISSLIFGAIHLFNDDFTLIGFFNLFLSGCLMGIILIKSETVSTTIGLHWAWNFIQGPIAGFNVSGHKETGVFQVERMAPNYITGGDFGAEGSILLIPITLIAIFIVWKYYKPATFQLAN
jgi:uncharacterized protein